MLPMETITYDDMGDQFCLSHFTVSPKLLTQSAVYDYLLSTLPYGSAIDCTHDYTQT